MIWKIKWEDFAVKQIKKLDKQIARRITSYLKEVVLGDPRQKGKPLTGDKARFWRYRVGEYRIICRIVDDEFVVLIVAVGHRKEIYN